MSSRPDFFIVGAPKCGTTALYTYLAAHPEVYMSPKKEPTFFGRDLRPPGYDMERAERVGAYLSLFDGRTTEKRAGEASPWYLYSKTAAEEIAAFCPGARIIIMLRNPVEMVYSAYYMFHKMSALSPCGVVDAETRRVMPFEEALRTQEERRQLLDRQRRTRTLETDFLALFHTDIARYTEQVERYLAAFDRQRVHVVLYDEFKRDTAGVYRGVLGFLDVDPDFRPELEVVNANHSVRSHRLHQLLRTGDTLVPLRRLMRATVPVRLRKAVARRLINDVVLVRRPRPPMDPHVAAWLRSEFEPDVGDLGVLLGRDLRTLWLGAGVGAGGVAGGVAV